jgi:ADP-glucose pyrophosphorylase
VIENAILDKNVTVPDGTEVGVDKVATGFPLGTRGGGAE